MRSGPLLSYLGSTEHAQWGAFPILIGLWANLKTFYVKSVYVYTSGCFSIGSLSETFLAYYFHC